MSKPPDLEQLSARWRKAVEQRDKPAADVERTRIEAERRLASLVADLAHGRVDEAAYEAGKAATAELVEAEQQALVRAEKVAESLGREAADLAEQEAVEKVEEARSLRDGIEADLAAARDRVRNLGDLLADADESLAAAAAEARSARAPFDAAAAEVAAAAARQEAEAVNWYAAHRPRHEAEWPSTLRAQIRDEVERRKAANEAERQRARETSERSLAGIGLGPRDRDFLRASRPNPGS
jgi:hypothetical protein